MQREDKSTQRQRAHAALRVLEASKLDYLQPPVRHALPVYTSVTS